MSWTPTASPSRRDGAAGASEGLACPPVPPRRARNPLGAKNDRTLSKARAEKPLTTRGSSRGARVNPPPRSPRPVASASRKVPESSSWVMPSRMMTGAAAPGAASSGAVPTASISSIGVIPAMASLEKLKP